MNGRPAAPVDDNKGGANLDPFDDIQVVKGYNAAVTSATEIDQIVNFRGPPMRMPAFDTTIYDSSDHRDRMIVPGATGANIKSNVGYAPACYVGLIVLPPAKL